MKYIGMLIQCAVITSAVKQISPSKLDIEINETNSQRKRTFRTDWDAFKLPEDKLLKVKNAADACVLEHNADLSFLIKLTDGTLQRDETSKKILYCFGLKTGLIDESGHVFIDKLVAVVGNHPRADEFREAIKKCNEVTKENPVETVVEFNNCYRNTAPIILAL